MILEVLFAKDWEARAVARLVDAGLRTQGALRISPYKHALLIISLGFIPLSRVDPSIESFQLSC